MITVLKTSSSTPDRKKSLMKTTLTLDSDDGKITLVIDLKKGKLWLYLAENANPYPDVPVLAPGFEAPATIVGQPWVECPYNLWGESRRRHLRLPMQIQIDEDFLKQLRSSERAEWKTKP